MPRRKDKSPRSAAMNHSSSHLSRENGGKVIFAFSKKMNEGEVPSYRDLLKSSLLSRGQEQAILLSERRKEEFKRQ